MSRAKTTSITLTILSLLAASAMAEERIDFAPVSGFFKLPPEMTLGPCSAVDVDSSGNIYVIQRSDPPILCFNSQGLLVRSWGTPWIGTAPEMQGAHGLRVDKDDFIWITDRDRHLVRKFDRTSRLTLTLGTDSSPGTGQNQFNRPADVAFGPDGEIFVADGYGNRRVMKFDSQGQFLGSWGEAGSAPGQFDLPHTIAIGPDKRVYVGDRWNSRIQIFDLEGKLQGIWSGFVPCGIAFDRSGNLFVVDGVSKVLQIDRRGGIVKSWGCEPVELGLQANLRTVPPIANPGGFRFVPHLMGIDAGGSLYLADVPNQMVHKLERTVRPR
jgi:DNA-binding beta-propeller fold protein YncE